MVINLLWFSEFANFCDLLKRFRRFSTCNDRPASRSLAVRGVENTLAISESLKGQKLKARKWLLSELTCFNWFHWSLNQNGTV